MDYTVVFDVMQSGYRNWWFPAGGLVIFVLVWRAQYVRREPQHVITPYINRFVLGFSIFWILSAFGFTFGDYRRLSSALRDGRCEVTEGIVTDFHPMPYTGHQEEWFVVNGKRFTYSDYGVTAGFNNTASHGGPMRQGIQVRVHHVGNKIARLEVVR